MIVEILLLTATAPLSGCDLASITSARSLHKALSRRAAKIIATASVRNSKTDILLGSLIDHSANFSLGGGDVGRPLGNGVAGARRLAETMNADRFRFLGWDNMDRSTDACGKHTVKVEFISTTDRQVSQVDFKFERARLIAAEGWQRSFESGALPRPQPTGNVR